MLTALAAACSSSPGDEGGGGSTSLLATGTPSTTAAEDRSAETLSVDLAGERRDREIATLLDFRTGAGGMDACSSYEDTDEYYWPVADDVALEVGSGDRGSPSPLGWSQAVCVGGAKGQVRGTVTAPGGLPVQIPPPGPMVRSGTLALSQAEPHEGPGVFFILTLPGSPAGTYEVELEDGRTFGVPFQTAVDAGAPARAFQVSMYEEVAGTTQDVAPGTVVEFGFVGQRPGATGVYFLFRAEQLSPCCLPIGTYTLVDRLDVSFDERGEAVRRLPTEGSPPRSCYVLVERSEALEDVASGGDISISGGEPTSFCVGASASERVIIDGCGALDSVLMSYSVPAGGHTFCSDAWGAIITYHASNYGFTVLANRDGSWTEVDGMNIGERSAIDLMVDAGVPETVAGELCRSLGPYTDGVDPGC